MVRQDAAKCPRTGFASKTKTVAGLEVDRAGHKTDPYAKQELEKGRLPQLASSGVAWFA